MPLQPNVITFHVYSILFFILKFLIALWRSLSQSLRAFLIESKSAVENASRFLFK